MTSRKSKTSLSWTQRVRRWEVGDIHTSPMAPAYKPHVELVDKRVKDAADSLEHSDRIHLHPWKQGLWVSAKTGRTYRGNGGKDRDEWALEQEGPWVLVDDFDSDQLVSAHDLEYANERVERLRDLIGGVAETIENETRDL